MTHPKGAQSTARIRALEPGLTKLREALREMDDQRDWERALADLARALEPGMKQPPDQRTEDQHDFAYIGETMEWIASLLLDESPQEAE